jgi:hypothetical protein
MMDLVPSQAEALAALDMICDAIGDEPANVDVSAVRAAAELVTRFVQLAAQPVAARAGAAELVDGPWRCPWCQTLLAYCHDEGCPSLLDQSGHAPATCPAMSSEDIRTRQPHPCLTARRAAKPNESGGWTSKG